MEYCRPVTELDIVKYLSGLELGDVKVIKFQNCPVPANPLSNMILAMGVVKLDSLELLTYNNVPRSRSATKFQGKY